MEHHNNASKSLKQIHPMYLRMLPLIVWRGTLIDDVIDANGLVQLLQN